jgi:hypothetical protein
MTEEECFGRNLVGTTQQNALWALNIELGDILFMYNFQSGILHGPFEAKSRADCYETNAWGGRFPVQVRFTSITPFRSVRAAERVSPETLKVLRRGGPLNAANATEL